MKRTTYYASFDNRGRSGPTSSYEFDKTFHIIHRTLRLKGPFYAYGHPANQHHILYVSLEDFNDDDRLVFALETGVVLIPGNLPIDDHGDTSAPYHGWSGYKEFRDIVSIQDEDCI